MSAPPRIGIIGAEVTAVLPRMGRGSPPSDEK
jgi:hypothetical protein